MAPIPGASGNAAPLRVSVSQTRTSNTPDGSVGGHQAEVSRKRSGQAPRSTSVNNAQGTSALGNNPRAASSPVNGASTKGASTKGAAVNGTTTQAVLGRPTGTKPAGGRKSPRSASTPPASRQEPPSGVPLNRAPSWNRVAAGGAAVAGAHAVAGSSGATAPSTTAGGSDDGLWPEAMNAASSSKASATGGTSSRGTAKRKTANAQGGAGKGNTGKGGGGKRGGGNGSGGGQDAGGDSKGGFWNYPRRGKGPIRRWLPSWKFLASLVGLMIITGGGLFAYLYFTTPIPEPEDMALAESTTVYYADGQTQMGTFAEINRQIIDPSTLPEHVGQAVVASEDRRFYQNSGIDPVGIARALWNNLSGNPRQGGSTLTQQYVERYYTGQTTGYWDKAEEVVLAIKIDRQQSKDEILGHYLNTIYFGRGAYGIEMAAQNYFGKSAVELTVSESALLAGVIPAPSRWDPAIDPDQAQQRWDRTLRFMVESGYITQAERDAMEYPTTIDPSQNNNLEGPNGYLLQMVRTELLNRAELTDEEIDTGGFTVISTIDPALQEAAVQAAQDIPDDHAPNLRVGLVSLDNETGAIRAAYGGADYLEIQRNAATQDVAQAGSTFKVFTLVAALAEGIRLEERFSSYSPMTIEPYGWEVNNYDLRGRGTIDLVEATAFSVNTSYAQLNAEVGPDKTAEMAVTLGLPETTSGLDSEISNVLGTASPTALQMAKAYSTLANEGVKREPFVVSEVRSGDDSTVYRGETEGERVIDAQVAADATYAMTQVIERGTGSTASEIGRPAAGKTGSSNEYRSAWFVGYVPQLTTAVAMFQPGEDGSEEIITPFGGYQQISGGSVPTTIWTNFMEQAVADLPVVDFPERSSPARPTYQPPVTPSTPQPTEEPTSEEPEPTPDPEPTPEPEPTPTPTTPPPSTPPPSTPAPTTPAPEPEDPDEEPEGG